MTRTPLILESSRELLTPMKNVADHYVVRKLRYRRNVYEVLSTIYLRNPLAPVDSR